MMYVVAFITAQPTDQQRLLVPGAVDKPALTGAVCMKLPAAYWAYADFIAAYVKFPFSS